MATASKWWCLAAAVIGVSGCKPGHRQAMDENTVGGESEGGGSGMPIAVELPGHSPAELDDPRAPVLRVELVGSGERTIPVPYLYGYPLYAEGPAIQGVRLLRQDNWNGYLREEKRSPDGLVRVVENFPELGCVFEGIQEDEGKYVPLSMECSLPSPKKRGGKRAVVGELQVGAKPESVPRDPALAKAFLGDWHATTPGFEAGTGAGYFDTEAGLIGFGFKKGHLSSIGFVFNPPEKRWRDADLWSPPAGVALPNATSSL